MNLPTVDLIQSKMESLRSRLVSVRSESIATEDCCGRVLGQDVFAFRDSPAVDVSAMDGYAVHHSDLGKSPLPVVGTATAGAAPLVCEAGTAIRIFTGGAVPKGADCVVPREHCHESPNHVDIYVPVDKILLGQNIRKRAENALCGSLILREGSLVDGPKQAALVSFADSLRVNVHRQVRVSILNTGDELLELGEPIQDWQIRDSNGPMLQSLLSSQGWIHCRRAKVPDVPAALRRELDLALQLSDVVIFTGGVLMGDTDHVPNIITDCGGEIIFHRIPIRPGKPLLGAVGPKGQLVLGLPGNPVSVAVTFRRYAVHLLRHMAGFRQSQDRPLKIQVQCEDRKKLELLWFRLAAIDHDGIARILSTQGSGDIAALGQSDGFVEIPPGTAADGTFPFFPWTF